MATLSFEQSGMVTECKDLSFTCFANADGAHFYVVSWIHDGLMHDPQLSFEQTTENGEGYERVETLYTFRKMGNVWREVNVTAQDCNGVHRHREVSVWNGTVWS